jgi:hypothetical protein
MPILNVTGPPITKIDGPASAAINDRVVMGP